MLFVLYVNDFPDEIDSMVLMFADDTKLFRIIESSEDTKVLQNDLNKLEKWSSTWLLKFHPGKCKVLTIGDLDKIVRPRAYCYELKNT